MNAEERLKSLQKAKSKGDGTLMELEEKISLADKERLVLLDRQRQSDAELVSLRDKVHQLEKLCDELRAEVARKYEFVVARFAI